MKKTLIALTTIAALGTGIISAQAETGFNAYENVGAQSQVATSASASGLNYEVNDGHNF
jgi:hypothetical protein